MTNWELASASQGSRYDGSIGGHHSGAAGEGGIHGTGPERAGYQYARAAGGGYVDVQPGRPDRVHVRVALADVAAAHHAHVGAGHGHQPASAHPDPGG